MLCWSTKVDKFKLSMSLMFHFLRNYIKKIGTWQNIHLFNTCNSFETLFSFWFIFNKKQRETYTEFTVCTIY